MTVENELAYSRRALITGIKRFKSFGPLVKTWLITFMTRGHIKNLWPDLNTYLSSTLVKLGGGSVRKGREGWWVKM